MLKNVSKNGLILGGFAVLTTALISLTFLGTKDIIAQQQLSLLQSNIRQVMPDVYYDNAIAQNCTMVTHSTLSSDGSERRVHRAFLNNQPSGLVIETTAPNGYSGNIHLLMGMLIDGTITGVRVIAHRETPGLGDKIDIRISDWILSFIGKQVSPELASQWEVKKDGGQFDQFTGATITPRAVVNQVEATALVALENQQAWLAQPENCQLQAGETRE